MTRATFVAIGAATRQVVAERDPLIARKVPLLAKAQPWVGHRRADPQSRHRRRLDRQVLTRPPRSRWWPPPSMRLLWFRPPRRRASWQPANSSVAHDHGAARGRHPDLPCIFPSGPEGRIGTGFHEISARKSDFALVAAAAQVAPDADGRSGTALAAGLGGAGDSPICLDWGGGSPGWIAIGGRCGARGRRSRHRRAGHR